MVFDAWHSKKLYEHPAKHLRGLCGIIEMSECGVYTLHVGGGQSSCPQDWAAKIHKMEQDGGISDPIIGRPSIGSDSLPAITVPESLKKAIEFKAAALGLSVPDARREAYLIFSK